jgi:hypothetical protein
VQAQFEEHCDVETEAMSYGVVHMKCKRSRCQGRIDRLNVTREAIDDAPCETMYKFFSFRAEATTYRKGWYLIEHGAVRISEKKKTQQ